MYDTLLLNATHKGRTVDVAIRDGRFVAIEPAGTLREATATTILDGTHKLLRAPFYNTHTHHAMTLLRGIDDDCPLMQWLTECIWPREAKLTAELVNLGTKLAIVESIRSGCVGFNDMYFHQPAIVAAATELGVRARVGVMLMNQVSDQIKNDELLALAREGLPPTIGLTIAPHALYTTTPDILKAAARQAEALGVPIHTHAAETVVEAAIAKEQFGFESPIAYLDACGLLKPGTLLAHCCHVSDEDLALMAQREVIVAHCPQSNQKLASGTFNWSKALAAGVRVTVGTDGAASNNGLSMIAEAKAAALQAKLSAGAPNALPFAELDRAVTETAAAALGFPNAGKIAVGAEADFILVDLDRTTFAVGEPDANFIYAGDTSCVDTVYCAGRCLMQGGIIPVEAELLAQVRAAKSLY